MNENTSDKIRELTEALAAGRRRLGVQENPEAEANVEAALDALEIDHAAFAVVMKISAEQLIERSQEQALVALLGGDVEDARGHMIMPAAMSLFNGLVLGTELERRRAALIAERLRSYLAEQGIGQGKIGRHARHELGRILDGEHVAEDEPPGPRAPGFVGDSADARIYRQEAIEHKRQRDHLAEVAEAALSGNTEADDLERMAREAFRKIESGEPA